MKKQASATDSTQGAASVERSLPDAFERHRQAALLVPTERVLVCRADLAVVYANARLGAASVLPHADRVRKELPGVDVERLREVPEIAAGLLHADAMATTAPAVTRADIDAQYAKLQKQREPMLLIAQGLALKDIFPKDRVDDIVRGNGMHNHALDGVQLAHLYATTPECVNKHPFTASDLAEATEAGHWILRNVLPDGARRPKPSPESASLRDRFWTLLVERHEVLRRVGFFLFGEAAVNDRVPLLQSRTAARPARESVAPAPGPDVPVNPS